MCEDIIPQVASICANLVELFGTPTWLPFHCFVTPIWPPWHHMKTVLGFGFIQVQFKLDTATLDYEQSLFILSPSSKMQGQANDHACDWRCEMAETPRFLCLVTPRLRAHALLNLKEKRDGSQCRYRPLTIKFPVCVITWHEFTWGPTKNPP